MDTGLPNRIWLVHAEPRPKVAWPPEPDAARLEACRVRIAQQIAALPSECRVYTHKPDAHAAWEQWYHNLPREEYARRLDAIGFRLLILFTFMCDKPIADLETVERVTALLNYERAARREFDSINADSKIARMEERVRRLLAAGPLTYRDLRTGLAYGCSK